jgi:hypothetical protein
MISSANPAGELINRLRQPGQCEMPEMVGTNMHLKPIVGRCPRMRASHHAGIVDEQVDPIQPGVQIHWIHFNHSMREPSAVIPVAAVVDDNGLVHIEGDDLSLVRWNHRPALVRAALERFGGRADWKPRWYLLAVPTEAFMGSARSVFSLAALDERRECYVIGCGKPAHSASSEVSLARQPHVQEIWAEQQARNAELHNVDHSSHPAPAGRRRVCRWEA